ncbi:PIN domain-containing protein [Candidatus Bathyarchaeota archaeon]|nr:PIN domain-containing protein [Candidatus Bathyarchaeota archaeon]
MESSEPIYVPSICLTEIKSRYLREGKNPTERIKLIIERSFIIPLNIEIALLAAEIKQKYKLHTVGAIIYATSKYKNLTLITGDQHFRDLPNVEMI